MPSIQVTFRSIPHSDAVEQQINKHFEKLNSIHSKISHCRVVLDSAHKNQLKTKEFTVSIDIVVHGKELACKKENEDIYIAIRDSFAAIEKMMEKALS